MQSNSAKLKKILVFGKTGVGKSSFLNYLYGSQRFKANFSGLAVTKEIQFTQGIPNSDISDFVLIDCPGLYDTSNEDGVHMNELLEKIKSEEIKGINAILYLFEFGNRRCTKEFTEGVKKLTLMFTTPDLWKHVSFVFTKTSYHIPEEEFKAEKEELMFNSPELKGFYTIITEIIKETIKELKAEDPTKYDKMEIPSEINCYFVDSKLDIKGKIENQRTDNQIKELLQWVRSLNFIDADSINKDFNPDYWKKVPYPDDKCEKSGDMLYYYHQYEYTDYSNHKEVKRDDNWYKEEKQQPQVVHVHHYHTEHHDRDCILF